MGVQADRLEMLFLHPQVCGRGLGTHMLAFAVKELGVRRLDVNEQNPAALKFYLSRGFRVTARSPLDSQGKPWPNPPYGAEAKYLRRRRQAGFMSAQRANSSQKRTARISCPTRSLEPLARSEDSTS